MSSNSFFVNPPSAILAQETPNENRHIFQPYGRGAKNYQRIEL
jgi:hypothetical protein